MPNMPSLINKKTLFSIVKGYQISNLTIKEDDENGVFHVSFSTLPPSKQQSMNAAMEAAPEAAPQERVQEVGAPMAAAARHRRVMVRTAMTRKGLNSLRRRYPDKFLRSMGLV